MTIQNYCSGCANVYTCGYAKTKSINYCAGYVKEYKMPEPLKKEIIEKLEKEPRHFEKVLINESDSNQKAKADAGKPRLTLVPRKILTAIARIREYGNAKYPEGGPDNYKSVEVDRYKDAMCRHAVAYLDDPHGVDEESGLPHLWHLACNVAFLCELEDEEITKARRNIK